MISRIVTEKRLFPLSLDDVWVWMHMRGVGFAVLDEFSSI
jgi:hypothetical protein